MSGMLFTAAPEFVATAMQEVNCRCAGKIKPLSQGIFFVEQVTEEEKRRLLSDPPIFLHHMHPATALPACSPEQVIEEIAACLRESIQLVPPGARVAVQARGLETEYTLPGRLIKGACDPILLEHALEPVVKEPEWIVSATVHRQTAYFGLSQATENLSDWAGGMIHFRKEPGDISRAKFKLLEAFVRFGLELPRGGRALDLGAAPGGWTSVLLEKGLQVVAVDTGELDGRLMGEPGLVFLRRNVGELALAAEDSFDLITCDMSWNPFHTVSMLNNLIGNLKPNGQVILTIKLMGKQPLQTVRRVVAALDASLQVINARHLFHNRQEITLHLHKSIV